MVPIFYVPFSLLGDIRMGNIFADVLIMLAAYWIAKSLNCKTALYAPLVYALLPVSIWLTSVTATNMMIGTAFMMLSFAALLRKQFRLAAVFLGLGVAANQLVILTLPLFGYYFWKAQKFKDFILSLAVSLAIILPFFVLSPSQFFYDVVTFQFVRPLQADGPFSLYSIVQTVFKIQLDTVVRVILFAVPFLFLTVLPKQRPKVLLLSAALILFLAAFVLPVNGLWNYFLPSFAIVCAFNSNSWR